MPSETLSPARRISADLTHLGVKPGGVLLVHSSFKSLGPVDGGAETVIQGLLDALGPEGTLLMPALSYMTVGPSSPVFDVKHTPSCVGWLPEYFRTRIGTLRSVHPTHSVCGVGPRASDLLAEHRGDTTPCGPRSPFSKLPAVGGQVLFLGCGLEPNTSMHAVEEHIVPPYLYGPPVTYRIVLEDGAEKSMTVTSHDFAGYDQRYDRLEAVMRGNGIAAGRVLAAGSFLLEAGPMWQAALSAYRADPLCFVERTQ